MKHPVVLFDGVCNLCNGAVQFLLKHDKKERLLFASLQSEAGQRLLHEKNLPRDEYDSFIVVVNGQVLKKSEAVLALCKELGGVFRFCLLFQVIPRFLRDYVYSFVAKNRYKWFGNLDQCMVPTPERKKRFLK